MQKSIKLHIKTLSNLFIGGAPIPFEIGGIDQQTAIDQEGYPYIPASSFKGALRAIMQEDNSKVSDDIAQLYVEYIKKHKNSNWEEIKKYVQEQDALNRINKKYEDAISEKSSIYLFGIKNFNNTPRLLFEDFILGKEYRNKEKCFSIDMKNSIKSDKNELISNPRTYKAARSALVFEGEILLYNIEHLGENADTICVKYIINKLLEFNNGVYRLGNSKSRGYGRIEVSYENESGEFTNESL